MTHTEIISVSKKYSVCLWEHGGEPFCFDEFLQFLVLALSSWSRLCGLLVSSSQD